MSFLKQLFRRLFGVKQRDSQDFNLQSYLMGGHISKTTVRTNRKK